MMLRFSSFAAFALLMIAAPVVRADDKKAEHPLVHTVIFYLKAGAPSGAADEILADCHEMLAKIPTVRVLKAGRPTEGTAGRAKKDYAVGLVILFDDAEGLKTYIEHPLHVKFVTKHLKNLDTSKLAGYDFLDAKK